MDSRQFVVFSDRPSTPYSPKRCSVRASSSPSFRLPAAEWFRSSSSRWSVSRAARGFLVLGPVVGALEALARGGLVALRQVTHHVLTLQSRVLAVSARSRASPGRFLPLRASVPLERTVTFVSSTPSSNRT